MKRSFKLSLTDNDQEFEHLRDAVVAAMLGFDDLAKAMTVDDE